MPPFVSNGPANKRRAGPSCDELPTVTAPGPGPGGQRNVLQFTPCDVYTSAALNGVTVGGHVIDIFLLPKKGTHIVAACARNSLTKSQSDRGHRDT